MDASPAVLRGLLFDFDGTIAETERFGHRVAYNRAFAELGLDWSWDEALYGELLAVAGGQERLRHFVETRRPDQAGIAGAKGFYERVHRVKGEHFARLAAEIPLRPGVLRLVAEAQAAGIAVGIAMNALHVDALAALYWSAVFNGFAAVPLIAIVVRLASDRALMGPWRSSRAAIAWGWSAVVLMGGAAAGLVFVR